jgi:hypothetical protein
VKPPSTLNIYLILKMKGRRGKSFLGVETSGRWVGTRKGGMRMKMVYFVSIYENGGIKPVEIVLRRGREVGE